MTSPYTSHHHGVIYDLACDVYFDLFDLFGIYVNSFKACIDACSNYRINAEHLKSTCGAVTYAPDLDPAKYDGNCYLKDSEAKIVPVARRGVASAKVHTGK